MDEDKELAMNKIHIKTIREHFGDDFFAKTLTIEKEQSSEHKNLCVLFSQSFLHIDLNLN